jgi:hypothetical protein
MECCANYASTQGLELVDQVKQECVSCAEEFRGV